MNYRKEFGSFWDQLRQLSTDVLSTNSKKSTAILISKTIAALLPLIQLYLIKILIDKLTLGTSIHSEILLILIVMGVTQWWVGILNPFTTHWETALQQEVNDRFSNRIISKTSRLSYALMESPTFQNNIYLAQQQARFRLNQLLPAIYGSFSSLLSIVLLIILFVGLKAYLFLFILLLALPITLHKWILGKKTADLEFTLAPKERESHYLFQILTGLPWAMENRIFGFGLSFQEKFQQIRKQIANEKNKILQTGKKSGMLIETIEVLVFIGLLAYLSFGVVESRLSLGLFILYLQGIQRLQASSKSFFQSLLQLFQLRTFVKDLYAFFELPEKGKALALNDHTLIDEICFANVSFRYPNSKENVLNNIHIKAKKGEVIAIVGENGSGKSTLVKLIAQLYQPEKGEVVFLHNGENVIVDLQNGNLAGFLFQDFQQYHYSVESNIHFAIEPSPRLTQKAKMAAEISGAHHFIEALANGYQSKLGNLYSDSVQLSGGQWQKLALSRIFFQKHDLIVLDEPSSALDAIAELELYQKIRTEFKESIVILISHRLYNLKLADRIYVLKEGRIADEGSFQDLITREGIFQTLYEKQKI